MAPAPEAQPLLQSKQVVPFPGDGLTVGIPTDLSAKLIRWHEANGLIRPPSSTPINNLPETAAWKVFNGDGQELRLSRFHVIYKRFRYSMSVLFPIGAPPKFVGIAKQYGGIATYLLGWLGPDEGTEKEICAIRVFSRSGGDIRFNPNIWAKASREPTYLTYSRDKSNTNQKTRNRKIKPHVTNTPDPEYRQGRAPSERSNSRVVTLHLPKRRRTAYWNEYDSYRSLSERAVDTSESGTTDSEEETSDEGNTLLYILGETLTEKDENVDYHMCMPSSRLQKPVVKNTDNRPAIKVEGEDSLANTPATSNWGNTMPENAPIISQTPQSHGTGTSGWVPVNRPVAPQHRTERGENAPANTMLTPASHGTQTSNNAPENLPATPQPRTEETRNAVLNSSTAPNHDNQVAERSDFSANGSASATPNVVPRKVVFTFLGDSDEDFTPRGQQPGAELFAKAREFFDSDVKVLYCLNSSNGTRNTLKLGYVLDVDAFIERMEMVSKYRRAVIYTNRVPFDA